MPMIDATVEALRADWADRCPDLDAAAASGPLVAPTMVPRTLAARKTFGVTDTGEVTRVARYTPRAARRVVTRWLGRRPSFSRNLPSVPATTRNE